jgi:ribosomal protein S30
MDYCKCAQDEIAGSQATDGSVICKGCDREKTAVDDTEGAGASVPDVPATPDEREVYLALKDSPKFVKRSTDDLPDIRKVIKKRKSSRVKHLLNQYGLEAVSACATKIYHSGAFTTAGTAEELYPDLFPADVNDYGANMKPEEPVYLNHMAMGRFLTTIQSALEHACYEFVAREMPEMIVTCERSSFKTAGLGPLMAFIQSPSIELKLREKGTPNLDEILESMKRVAKYDPASQPNAAGALQRLQDADRLIGLLGVESGHPAIQALQENVESRIGEFVAEKRRYTDRLREKKEYFEAERMKLQQMENEAVGALGNEEGKFEREATFEIIQKIRSAEDILFEECLGGKLSMLSLE